MKQHRYLSILLCGLGLTQAAHADSTLEYLVTENSAKQGKLQPVIIKDGKVLLRGVGGDKNMDILYASTPESLFLIDHHKRNVTTLDETGVNHMAKQTETVQPLLQGLAGQVAKLNPKQRAKWEEMLGGKVSLDNIAQAAQPVPSARIVKTGKSHKVAGIACEAMEVFEDKKRAAQFCLADPAELKIPQADYATIRALIGFTERLATKTQGLARQFGVGIPNIDLHGMAGVPIELQDEAGNSNLRLQRIDTAEVSAGLMHLPKDYPSEPFKLWK